MTAPATVVTPPTPLRRLQVWRSPVGQPAWARPVLLGIAAVAAFSYAWGNTGVNLETFYAAAVRSMSQNWHNFFFASFDPWGTVSVDKLPGSFWVQALSLRIFGFHLWALVLPQVVEGTLTVLVLYRAVRRVAGSGAGLVAAAALALSPVTVLLNRGNISDTLLILLLVLAADATLRATTSGRWPPLALAGVWVGLAFQAKMAQAWLLLPVLALVYLLAAPSASLARRCGHVVVMGLCALVVSLSWMSAVALVPAHDRPYVDGSCDNSIYSQVFVYNGADRVSGHLLDQAGCRATSPPIQALAARPPIAGRRRSGFGPHQRRPGQVPGRDVRPVGRVVLRALRGGPAGSVGLAPQGTPHRPAADRHAAVAGLAAGDLALFCQVEFTQLVLPGRPGTPDGGAVRPGLRRPPMAPRGTESGPGRCAGHLHRPAGRHHRWTAWPSCRRPPG